MSGIRVTHLSNSCYRVVVGGHRLLVDQPESAGGDDQGPTPLQLLAASLLACTAYYAGSYLARHGLSTEGLDVEGDFVMAKDKPPRIVSLSVRITPPPGLSARGEAALLAVASHCTVHNTLLQPPAVHIGLSGQPVRAARPTPDDPVGPTASSNGAIRLGA